MCKKLKLISLLLAMGFSSSAFSDIAIIGHPGDSVGDIDTQNVRRLFLGERKSFPSGIHATPINHTVGSPDRKEFFSSILSMGESSHNRHWKRKISKGGGNSPKEVGSHTDLLKSIANTPGSIGYIDASKVDDSVKVLFTVSNLDDV